MSGPCFCFDSCLRSDGGRYRLFFFKFWPDTKPRFLAEHLSRKLSFSGFFNAQGLGRIHVAPTGKALIEVLLACAYLRGEVSAPLWLDVEFFKHGANTSVTLLGLQAFRLKRFAITRP